MGQLTKPLIRRSDSHVPQDLHNEMATSQPFPLQHPPSLVPHSVTKALLGEQRGTDSSWLHSHVAQMRVLRKGARLDIS